MNGKRGALLLSLLGKHPTHSAAFLAAASASRPSCFFHPATATSAAAATALRVAPLSALAVGALSFSSLSRAVTASDEVTSASSSSSSSAGAPSSRARRLFSGLTTRFASSSSSSSSSASSSMATTDASSSTAEVAWRERITLLAQAEAQAIDEELMQTPGFSVDQLMELAGLSVAQAVDDFLQHKARSSVLLVCGPGNNGGDGLVAARHLHHFGYRPTVVYPKRPAKQLYTNLVKQCEDLGIEVAFVLPDDIDGKFDAVVDALFGFGSTGPLRAPFDEMLRTLAACVSAPILSVDIPSGWDVEKGDAHGTGFVPEALISLTAPKKCAAFFRGRHYLGGRFVPPAIRSKYKLRLPAYPGTSQFVEVVGWDREDGGAAAAAAAAVAETIPADKATEFVFVFVTAPNKAEAGALAEKLVSSQLAACVNLVPGVESVYQWEGKIEKGEEVLMLAKTRAALLPEFSAFVKEHHSYTVPETIAGGILGGSRAYLDWLRESTKAAEK